MEAPTVQLNDIALFVEVAKRKSFSLAARAGHAHVHLIPPHQRAGAGHRLRLINRNTRRLDLTGAGAHAPLRA